MPTKASRDAAFPELEIASEQTDVVLITMKGEILFRCTPLLDPSTVTKFSLNVDTPTEKNHGTLLYPDRTNAITYCLYGSLPYMFASRDKTEVLGVGGDNERTVTWVYRHRNSNFGSNSTIYPVFPNAPVGSGKFLLVGTDYSVDDGVFYSAWYHVNDAKIFVYSMPIDGVSGNFPEFTLLHEFSYGVYTPRRNGGIIYDFINNGMWYLHVTRMVYWSFADGQFDFGNFVTIQAADENATIPVAAIGRHTDGERGLVVARLPNSTNNVSLAYYIYEPLSISIAEGIGISDGINVHEAQVIPADESIAIAEDAAVVVLEQSLIIACDFNTNFGILADSGIQYKLNYFGSYHAENIVSERAQSITIEHRISYLYIDVPWQGGLRKVHFGEIYYHVTDDGVQYFLRLGGFTANQTTPADFLRLGYDNYYLQFGDVVYKFIERSSLGSALTLSTAIIPNGVLAPSNISGSNLFHCAVFGVNDVNVIENVDSSFNLEETLTVAQSKLIALGDESLAFDDAITASVSSLIALSDVLGVSVDLDFMISKLIQHGESISVDVAVDIFSQAVVMFNEAVSLTEEIRLTSATAAPASFAWLVSVKFGDEVFYFTSWANDIIFNGHTWKGDGLLQLYEESAVAAKASNTLGRVVLAVDSTNDNLAYVFENIRSLSQVVSLPVYSRDMENWTKIDHETRAFLSSPFWNGEAYSFDVVNFRGRKVVSITHLWSGSKQQERFPGDKFFDFASDIEKGVDIKWPP